MSVVCCEEIFFDRMDVFDVDRMDVFDVDRIDAFLEGGWDITAVQACSRKTTTTLPIALLSPRPTMSILGREILFQPRWLLAEVLLTWKLIFARESTLLSKALNAILISVCWLLETSC